MRTAHAVAILLAVALLAACNRGKESPDVVAQVNGRRIARSEVDKYYNNQTAGAPQQPSGEQATSLRLGILQELINNEILMLRAEKLGLLATDEEVDRKLNEIKAPYTQEDFNKRLKDRNLSLDDFRRDLRRSVTVDKVLNKEITSKISVSDADIAAYYNAHKAEFNLIEPQYHLAHIIVTTQPNPQVRNLNKAQNESQAKAKIQQLLNRLDSGEDFAAVASNYSEDPETSGSGGDLGFIPQSALKRERTDPATIEALNKLKPGQYSGIIPVVNPVSRQPVGYRIVKLISREPAGQRELNDPRVQQSIREQLRDRREQLLRAAYYEVLRDQAKIENYYAEQVLKSSGQ